MSSEIHELDSAVFSLQPAWHGKGKTFENVMTSAEALSDDSEGRSLDWTVIQKPAGYMDDDGVFRPFEGRMINLRDDIPADDNRGQLAIVSDRYVIVQQAEAFTFLDSLVMDGIMKYEAAFSMFNGKRVCILARMPQVDEVAEGDTLERFILWSNNHDGTAAAEGLPTDTRVVCANTRALAYSIAGDTDRRITITHQGDLTAKLEAARRMIQSASKRFDQSTDDARTMASKTISDSQFSEYLDSVVPVPEIAKPIQRKHLEKIRDTITGNYLIGKPQQLPSIKRTAWAAYNAVSEFIDHDRKHRTSDTRLRSVLWGRGSREKNVAHGLALELAASN